MTKISKGPSKFNSYLADRRLPAEENVMHFEENLLPMSDNEFFKYNATALGAIEWARLMQTSTI